MYWRPGCGFCSSLRRRLHAAGIALHEVNIWEDARAAATVRRITGGDETVPTVVVGRQSLVNPSPARVYAAIATEAPHLLPEGFEPPKPNRLGRLVLRLLGHRDDTTA